MQMNFKHIYLWLILLAGSILLAGYFFSIPLWVRSLKHQIFEPENLYKPIITDSFEFYEKGFTRTYSLQPKYLDYYEIGFTTGNKLGSKYKFKGKVKVEFFWKEIYLFESLITSWDSASHAGNDMDHYKDISLFTFDMPLQGKYKENISVKLTVLEPDQELEKYKDLIKLYIRVSTSP